jgi:methylthioribose-1-phosphate isomerase
MKIMGTHYRGIWCASEECVRVIDQTRLPFEFEILELVTVADAARAIRTMVVRGAPLIGATGAYGMALAAREDSSTAHLTHAAALLKATRPTAVDLARGVDRIHRALLALEPVQRREAGFREAAAVSDAYVDQCHDIGRHGIKIIRELARTRPCLNILTHCNAGWLATVDWGTALSPVYMAHDAGIPLHVWVDETRPRNQGALLTAFELAAHGVPHTVIADNLGGHLMQHGKVDMVIVGADRVTAAGDVCNKVGTYLKALAAQDNGVPFYAAMPTSTIDWSIGVGAEIPIEQRSAEELTHMTGSTADGRLETIRVIPQASPALNLGFDVTPARLITALITEHGPCAANRSAMRDTYANRAANP